MRFMVNVLKKKSVLSVLGALLVVAAAGTAMAASGVSALVLEGDDGVATARGAQEPLGTLSARPGETRGVIRRSASPDNGNEVADTQPVPETQPVSQAVGGSSGAGGGGGAGKLPFTGFVAIPMLLLGAALLGFGVVARRRPLNA